MGRLRTTGKGTIPQEIQAESVAYDSVNRTAATLTLTEDDSGRMQVLTRAAGITVTLPAATGSGATYNFFNGLALSAASHIIKVANTVDIIQGIGNVGKAAASAATFAAAATDDTITLNATTSGGLGIGDVVSIQDVKSGVFAVLECNLFGSGTVITPFSATV